MAATLFSRVLEYLQTLTVTQGQGAGEPLQVLPWQRRFIREVLRPEHRLSALSVARGNGKTTILAALACAYLVGPLAQQRGEIVLVAASFDQARIAYDHVLAFLAVEQGDPDWRIADSSTRAEATHLPTGARIKARGALPRTAHGLAPALVLADEPAQWNPRSSETMLSALTTALGKVPGSRMIALGTRPADPEHWFQRWLDGSGSDYALSYAPGPDADPMKMATIRAANPSLGHMPELKALILRDRERARGSPAAMASYQALRLNAGVSDTHYSYLLDPDTWRACESDALPPPDGPCVWGMDLGATAAMSAVAAYWPRTGRLEVMAAFPGEGMTLAERGRRDGVADAYLDMERRGELITTPGRTVDVARLCAEAHDRYGPPVAVASDRWREGELLDGLEEAAVPAADWSARGMGYRDQGDDVRRFQRRAIDGQIHTPESHLMRRAMSGCRVSVDPAGNQKIAKSGAGRSSMHRDDACVAAVMAVAEGDRRMAAETETGGDPGWVTL